MTSQPKVSDFIRCCSVSLSDVVNRDEPPRTMVHIGCLFSDLVRQR